MDDNSAISLETPGQDSRAPVRDRVLAVRGGALGDFILTLPALRALGLAGYEVELLTRPAYGRLAQEAGMVSGWRPLDSPEAASLHMVGAVIDPDWQQWLSGFNIVVSWLPDADGAFRGQVLRCGAGTFYQGDGRCGGTGPAAFQLAEAVAFTGSRIHPVHDLFASDPMSGNDAVRRIAFHPGSGGLRKIWPLEHWLEVMASLSGSNPEIMWLVITGEVEEERLPDLGSLLERAGLRWESAHSLDLALLCHRLRECGAFLGHDSGISHLAAACGVSCRLLFGPTNPAVWAPLGDHVEVLGSPDGTLPHLTSSSVKDWLRLKLF